MPDITGDGVNDLDITTAGSSTIIGGVTFTDAVNVGSGTGGYNTFLAISDNDGIEQGFNSDDTPPIDATNKDIDQAKTHTVLLSSLVIVTVGGQQYYQVRVDLNEANSDPNAQISLDQFKVYTSTNGAIESTTNLFNPANATLKYDMDAGGNVSVLMSDAESSGSGTDDYSVLIPVSTFAGQDPTTTYVYFFIQMGAAGADWNVTSTFEEWNLENGVALTGTKFEDIDGDGVKDAGEGPVQGVTIFIDANKNGVLDAGERTTVTDANGNYTFFGVTLNQTVWIDEVIPAGATQTTGAHEEVVISSNATGSITVDPIGNFVPHPAISIEKLVHDVDGDTSSPVVDEAGDIVNYTIDLSNTGNVTLTGLLTEDQVEALSETSLEQVLSGGHNTGDTNANGNFDPGETWHFTASYTVTQDDIDNNGGSIPGFLSNVARATTTQTAEVDDDAIVPIEQNPAIAIEKTAALDDGGDCVDEDGDIINYTYSVTNAGNVALDNVVVVDDKVTVVADDADLDGFNDGDLDEDGLLDVDETWTYSASYAATQDDIDNAGDGDGFIHNNVTANGEAAVSGEAALEATDEADVEVCQLPAIAIEKTAALDDGGDCVDEDGDIINYTYSVTNAGNVALDNVVVVDDKVTVVADDADLDGFNDGDLDEDGLLDVDETWTYSASYTATQDDIDNAGDGDGFIHNNVTANGEAAVSGEAALEATDEADVEVCQLPAIAIEKTAALDDGGDCVDEDGDIINYTYSVTNAGNVALDNVVVVDDKVTVVADDADLDGFNDGDLDEDGLLDVDETWTYSASYTATQDDIDNNGDGDGFIHNNVTANGEAAVSGEAALEATDEADVEVCPAPAIAIEKTAALDDGGDCVDEDGDIINYTYSVTNAGNVALDNVVVVDDKVTVVADDADLDGFNDGDLDEDGLLDVDETWTYSASYTATQDDIDNAGDGDGFIHNNVTANGDAEVSGEAALEATDEADVEVCQLPAIAIEKTAALDDGGDCVDEDGDIINYTYSVTNAGNVALDNVVVVDDKVTVVADDADLDGHNDGDTDDDGLLDLGETWTYTASYTATQDDIDNNGDGGSGFIHNNVTANGDAAVSGEAALEATDEADVEVCQLPGIDLEKYVAVDSTDGTDGNFVDADAALGPENVNLGSDVWFKVTVENTGNVTLTDVDITDDNQTGGGSVLFDLMQDGALTFDAISNHSATLDGDTDNDGDLDVGETWTITYRQAFDPGEHVNTATVTTAEGQTDDDAAHYFSLVDEGLCPRTPGFWQNPKNGGQFWDGIQGNEKHAGEAGFPDGELLYAVDSNNNGSIGAGDVAGLLIGDYNHDGLSIGEDTLFVSYADARTLINASNKQLNGSSGDGRFMLGRDMVASWLNYLQGSGFGDESDPQSPHHYLDDSIDWMQIYSGKTAGGTNETFDTLLLTGGAIKTNTAIWKTPVSGIDHSAGQMHSALDYYNNTGQTEPGGTHYANCESQHLFEALTIYQQSHELV